MLDFNLLEVKDSISILSDIGTFLSAFFAMIAIFEIKRQRLSSYKPEIILDSFVSKFYAENFLTSNDDFRYKTEKYLQNNQKAKISVKKYPLINYLLQNIGFGTAKYIEGYWEFDYKKASKVLEKYLSSNFVIEEDKNGFCFRDKGNDIWIFFSNFYLKEKDTIDFLLQESTGENGKGQTIPAIITQSFSYYVILKYKLKIGLNEENVYEEFEEMPKPIFKITYKDFNNRKHSKKFELNFKYVGNSFDLPDREINDCGVFYIDVTEK